METPMEATPRPWTYYWDAKDNGEADCGILSGAEVGRAVSVCRAPRFATREQWEANAALIVRAVNSFDELVAACYSAEQALLHGNGGQQADAAFKCQAALQKARG